MTITFIQKGALEILPPILPRLICIAKTNHVNLICTKISEYNKNILRSNNISFRETLHNITFLKKKRKILDWINFRISAKRILDTDYKNTDVVYVCSADTAMCLGSILNGRKYIFQCNELYDKFPIYKYCIKKYAKQATAFVVPDFSRANIFQVWFGLKNDPFVIPNIPFIQSTKPKQDISDPKAKEILNNIRGKKIILNQGHISSSDRSLTSIAEALQRINDPSLALVLMGIDHNKSVPELISIYKNTFHIPFVAPPLHLEITSHAYIGTLSYNKNSLNNIFCAPNKIYEYSVFGIPMLGNDIPGLRNSILTNKMGLCVSYNDSNAIAKSILELEKNHSLYANNAKDFYDGVCLEKSLCDLIKYVK